MEQYLWFDHSGIRSTVLGEQDLWCIDINPLCMYRYRSASKQDIGKEISEFIHC